MTKLIVRCEVCQKYDDVACGRKAEVSDLLEALQAEGVGEVVESVMDADADSWWVPVDSHVAPGDDAFDEPGRWFLVIPVSDGGEDR